MLDSRRHLLLVLVAVTFAGNACAVLEDRSLYFSLMVSTAPGLNTAVVAPAVELTLENINSDPTMLPGYTLHYTRVADTKVSTTNCCLKVYSLFTFCCDTTQCNSTRALQLFHEELQCNKTVLSVIGGGCSTATELVARNASIPVVRFC